MGSHACYCKSRQLPLASKVRDPTTANLFNQYSLQLYSKSVYPQTSVALILPKRIFLSVLHGGYYEVIELVKMQAIQECRGLTHKWHIYNVTYTPRLWGTPKKMGTKILRFKRPEYQLRVRVRNTRPKTSEQYGQDLVNDHTCGQACMEGWDFISLHS